MLGLPLVIASAGFLPSSLAFFCCWAFMASTGLLLLEANLWFGEGIHLMTLAERTLGRFAKGIVAISFAFLFYSLLVAYLAGGGQLISEISSYFFSIPMEPFLGSLALVLIFGIVLLFGTGSVDLVNRILMLGLGGSYLGLVLLGVPEVQKEHLLSGVWKYALPALPAMIISFGFHNLVPSLTTYLKGNASALKRTVIWGSLIPLLLYLIWDALILGILAHHENIEGAIDSGTMVTQLFSEAVGKSYVVDLMHFFSFFALVTSFLAVSLSFVDFLADGLSGSKGTCHTAILVVLVLAPPCLFSYLYPYIFLTALNYAGAFGAVLLFGIIPVLMVYKGRYYDERVGIRFVKGGKPVLGLIGVFAFFIFFMQLINELGV